MFQFNPAAAHVEFGPVVDRILLSVLGVHFFLETLCGTEARLGFTAGPHRL